MRSQNAEESLEEKINFKEKNLGGVLQGNSFQLALKGGKNLGNEKLITQISVMSA